MISEVIECEVKLRIASRADLRRLLDHLPTPRRWGLQLNIYLDTASRDLQDHGLSFRLRVTPDHARLTLKSGRGVAGATFSCLEREAEVNRAAAVAWIEGGAPLQLGPAFDDVTLMMAGQPLVAVNWSRTHRAICEVDGITVEADETMFSDGSCDWEVEVETPDPEAALAVLRRISSIAGVSLVTQTQTKQARAMACIPSMPIPIPTGDPSVDALDDVCKVER